MAASSQNEARYTDLREPPGGDEAEDIDMTSSRVASAESQKSASDYNPANRGPIKNRGCTDILCLLIFIAFLVGWGVVGVYGFYYGNPMTLLYPSDSNGEICGRGNNEGRPYLFFFDITKCLKLSSAAFGCPTKQVCVEKCPDKIRSPWGELKLNTINEAQAVDEVEPYCDPMKFDKNYGNGNTPASDMMKAQICPEWFVTSRSILGRCIPFFREKDGEPITNDTILFEDGQMSSSYDGGSFTVKKLTTFVKRLADVLNLRTFGEKVIRDVIDSWWIILIGVILASIVAFLWVILMRFVAAVMVWASIILSVALSVLSCVYCGFKFSELYESGDSFDDFGFTTNIKSYLELSYTWLVFLFISGIVLLIILILLCFMRTRIKIAIELIEEASIAVGHMMSTLFFPIVPFVFEVIFVGWFILVAMFLASSGIKQYHINISGSGEEPECPTNNGTIKNGQECFEEFTNYTCTNGNEATCQFHKYGITAEIGYMQVYNLFGFLWGMFFLSALDEIVLAGAFASWYWTLNKKDVPSMPLMSSFYRAMRYHLGTLAFGSLIIAIIRMIRYVIEYIEEKLKEYHQDNPLVKCCLCFCKCCFYCLEKFMKFLNRNAYIMTAIYGKNFCWSAKEAFKLLFRNIARVFVLDKVTDFLLLLGKLVIVGCVGVGSFYVFSGRINNSVVEDQVPELNYYFVPVIIITLSAYFIADIFFGVYEMGVDTLFLCFLEDIERNDGTPEKPYFMSKDLKKILGYMESKSASRPTSPNKD